MQRPPEASAAPLPRDQLDEIGPFTMASIAASLDLYSVFNAATSCSIFSSSRSRLVTAASRSASLTPLHFVHMGAAVELSGVGGMRGFELDFDSVCLTPHSFCSGAVLLCFRGQGPGLLKCLGRRRSLISQFFNKIRDPRAWRGAFRARCGALATIR